MKTRIHIIIMLALICAFTFAPDLFGSALSRIIEAKYKAEPSVRVYKYGEYTPISIEAPKSFVLVAVREEKTRKEEKYFTKFGEAIVLSYEEEEEVRSGSSFSVIGLFFFLPLSLVAFALVAGGSLSRAGRTGRLIGFDFNRRELLLQAYGFSLLISLITIGIRMHMH